MAADADGPDVRAATFDEIDTSTLYAILRLRAEVFVVEQQCPYLDLDGRDTEPGARHLWIEEDGRVVATLRLLVEPNGGHRIGRVATSPDHRRRGLAQRLTEHALQLVDGRGSVVLDAQAPLSEWYERLGFRVDGAAFVEDGIRHVPMRRP